MIACRTAHGHEEAPGTTSRMNHSTSPRLYLTGIAAELVYAAGLPKANIIPQKAERQRHSVAASDQVGHVEPSRAARGEKSLGFIQSDGRSDRSPTDGQGGDGFQIALEFRISRAAGHFHAF